ncbi:MAG TPA: hypothetical protein VGY97_05540 [Solirubrobacteraceae bacterium]|jgi:hypothetical protein|nr:hypothetical protein [Solirubrobacteraceae bacterium]
MSRNPSSLTAPVSGARLVLAALALALLASCALAAGARADAGLSGYDGTIPFKCQLQEAGTGTNFPNPNADPFCVEYDKTHQSVSDGGIVQFLSQEPARFAVAGNKCFYFQRDHWRSTVIAGNNSTQTYNWDGDYWWDEARGVGGAYVRNFSVNGQSGDPTQFPGFPAQWKPYFGQGSGGVQSNNFGVPVNPTCVAKAAQSNPYAQPTATNGAPHSPSATRGTTAPAPLRLVMLLRRRRGAAGCLGSRVRVAIAGTDAAAIRTVGLYVNRHLRKQITRPPFARRVHLRCGRRSRITAVAQTADGRSLTLNHRVRARRR